jgi:hypothetical protein
MGCFCRLWFKSSEPKNSNISWQGKRYPVLKRGCSGCWHRARRVLLKQKNTGNVHEPKDQIPVGKTKFKEVKIYGQNQNETYRLP